MPKTQQSKLLRILENGQFRRVGGRKTRNVDVRIICASNRHLWDAVRDGHFREDLYYRIACLTVRLPSLRERIDDIEVLSRSLLEPVNEAMQKRFYLTDDAIARLKAYEFPGNIRELRNILFVAVTHNRQAEITGAKINQVIEQLTHGRHRQPADSNRGPQEAAVQAPTDRDSGGSAITSLEENEARHIAGLLERFDGNRRKVAESLAISERTLYRKLKKYALS
jgi:DNA-binding NtrC family response regulator